MVVVVLNKLISMARESIVHYIQELLAPSLHDRVGKVLRKQCSLKKHFRNSRNCIYRGSLHLQNNQNYKLNETLDIIYIQNAHS